MCKNCSWSHNLILHQHGGFIQISLPRYSSVQYLFGSTVLLYPLQDLSHIRVDGKTMWSYILRCTHLDLRYTQNDLLNFLNLLKSQKFSYLVKYRYLFHYTGIIFFPFIVGNRLSRSIIYTFLVRHPERISDVHLHSRIRFLYCSLGKLLI